jgi:hypothetical protein
MAPADNGRIGALIVTKSSRSGASIKLRIRDNLDENAPLLG